MITSQKELHEFISELPEKSRTGLLPVLIKAQELFGFIPEESVNEISGFLHVPKAEIYGVIEFYSLLYAKPTAKTVIRVCTSPVCSSRGSEKIKEALCEQLGIGEGETTDDGLFMVESVQCLGMCDHAPSALVGNKVVTKIGEYTIGELLGAEEKKPENKVISSNPVLSKRCCKGNPESLDEYLDSGGFNAFKFALKLSPKTIFETIKISGLKGRGGAGFPTGIKGENTAGSGEDIARYVVCNADESEPGSFKDRVLLSTDPFSILEGMLIAAFAVNARKGYIYIRGEYFEQRELFSKVVEKARKKGFLGEKLFGTDFSFDIEVRSGAGAYICGEETALFESVEGKRGIPRNKPPFPVTKGLFNHPTEINNVETFSYITRIMEDYKENGNTADYRPVSGTKLFCLSGDVARPGVYEMPFGTKLGDLIFDYGGGIPGGRKPKAVILGGASGMFVPESQWDIPLDHAHLKEAGLTMGSGVIMVFDERRDICKIVLEIAEFFQHESCGQCYPCQLGTSKQLEIIQRIYSGEVMENDYRKLEDIAFTMQQGSICGLGQTAGSAITSAMKLWPEIFTSKGVPVR